MTSQLTPQAHTPSLYSGKVGLSYLSPTGVAAMRDDLAKRLDAVSDRLSGEGADETLSRGLSGEVQFWLITVGSELKGVWVTEEMNGGCHVIAVQGDDMSDWMADAVQILSKQMKAKGLSYIETVGRYGWVRQLQEYGFKTMAFAHMEIK